MTIKRTPRFKYKIRKVTCGNKSGDSYAITIPRIIAQDFTGVSFFLTVTDTSIILESGCSIFR